MNENKKGDKKRDKKGDKKGDKNKNKSKIKNGDKNKNKNRNNTDVHDLMPRSILSLQRSTSPPSTCAQNAGEPNSENTFAARMGSLGEYPWMVRLTPL